MKHTLGIIILLCTGIISFSQQTFTGSIMHDDIERTYIIYIPEMYTGDSAVPLVLNYHGFGSSAEEQMYYGDFRPIADTAGFLLVHPQGTLLDGVSHWNVGGWTTGSTVDDVGFTSALIDSLAAIYNIDIYRVYSTGMSNGGFMSFRLACQLSNEIAAIASVTGSMTPETYDFCLPQHPFPILQFHGTWDYVVPYTGASFSKPIEEVIDYWVTINNCDPDPVITDLPDLDPNDGSTVTHFAYYNGDDNTNVEHFRVNEGMHTWPGSAFGGTGTNYDIDASAKIWKFFYPYSLTNTTDIEYNEPVNTFMSIYPNPAYSELTISRQANSKAEYRILSTSGATIKTGRLMSQKEIIDISSIQEGIYILRVNKHALKVIIHK